MARVGRSPVRGNCNEVWAGFGKRQKAKVGKAANEETGGEDMFSKAGIAAE